MLSNYLTVSDLNADDLHQVLDEAYRYTQNPDTQSELLRGRIVGMYFTKPSTRTRVSFSAAITRLGGTPEMLGPNDLQLGRGETIEDTAAVISRYADAFVIRTFDHEDVARFAGAASIPVINALTDLHHPCQALADLLTLQQRFGPLRGLRLAYVGDGNNVAHSLVEAGALAGMDVAIAAPHTLWPDAGIVQRAQVLAAEHGGRIRVTANPHEAVQDADAVYTDVWLSMGDDPATREHRTDILTPYRVDDALMRRAAPHAVFMHCLPAHRGDEVTATVIDGPRSIVFDQAGNRMPTEQAILASLIRGTLSGQSARKAVA